MTSMRGGCGWARLTLVVGVVAVLVFAGDAGGQTCRTLGPQAGMAATLVDTSGDPAIAAVVRRARYVTAELSAKRWAASMKGMWTGGTKATAAWRLALTQRATEQLAAADCGARSER